MPASPGDIAAGARLIFTDGRLRAFGVNVIVGGFANSLVGTLYMLFVVNALGFKPGVLGVIFAVGGASSLFGALAARRSAEIFGTGRAMVAGLAIEGVAYMLLPIARGSGPISIALLVVQQLIGDSAATVYFINAVSLIQTITPRAMLGRVNASPALPPPRQCARGAARGRNRGRRDRTASDDRDRCGGFVGHGGAARLLRSRLAHWDGGACRSFRRRLIRKSKVVPFAHLTGVGVFLLVGCRAR